MAGRSQGSRFAREVERRGGAAWIAAEISAGRSLRCVAREVGCGRWWLDRWIYADAARKEHVLRARARVALGP